MATKLKSSQKGKSSVDFEYSHAFIIGINDYQNGIPALHSAENDARALAVLLAEKHGYIPHLFIEEVNRTKLTEIFSEIMPQRVKENDRVLLYFAGHGVALDGENGPEGYLLPQDAYPEDSDTFSSMKEVHKMLSALKCRHLLVILDCCFAGTFRWTNLRDVSSFPKVIHQEQYERFIREPAWQVLTSTAYDQKALDTVAGEVIGLREQQREENSSHSPFALALFDALNGAADLVPKDGGDGIITTTELYLYLRDQVEKGVAHYHNQTPGLWPLRRDFDKGEYVFLDPNRSPNLPPAPELNLENNPYRGLEAYDKEHAELFFGRTEMIKALASHLEKNNLTIVLGASGTGKSSLVKAGLVPFVEKPDRTTEEIDLDLTVQWHVIPSMRPTEFPLKELLLHLNIYIGQRESLKPLIIKSAIQQTLRNIQNWSANHLQQKLLLIIDQFEEVITLCHDEKERARFLAVLEYLLEHFGDQIHIIITLRTDFEPQLMQSSLAPFWNDARFIVLPMTQTELREVIEKPAFARALFFEPASLVDRLIDEVIQTPGVLPLLSFTLREMYIKYVQRQSTNRALVEEDYIDLGGVIGALRYRATEEYDLLDSTHQRTMKQIMLRMVAVEGGELAKRRVYYSELVYPEESKNNHVAKVIRRLEKTRLVVSDKTEDNVPFVEPAHAALIRAWDKLLIWTREAEDYLPLQRRLNQAVVDWQNEGNKQKKQNLLWNNDPRLPQIENILVEQAPSEINWIRNQGRRFFDIWNTHPMQVNDDHWLNRDELKFVQESIQLRRKESRQFIGTIFMVVLILSVLTGFASYQVKLRNDANENAEEQAKTALAQSLVASAPLQANDIEGEDDELATLLALEAVRLNYEINGQMDRALDSALRPLLSQPHYSNILAKRPISGNSVAFSSNSNMLATAWSDGQIWLWDLEKPETKPIVIQGHIEGETFVAFSQDDMTVATGGQDGLVKLWQVANPLAEPEILKVPDRPENGSEINISDLVAVSSLAFSPKGRQWFAVGTEDGRVLVWDREDINSEALVLEGQSGRVSSVSFSPNGEFLASGYSSGVTDSTILLYRTDNLSSEPKILTATEKLTLIEGGRVQSVAFSHDSKTLAFAVQDDFVWGSPQLGSVRRWNFSAVNEAPIILEEHIWAAYSLAFSPDGLMLSIGSLDATVRLIGLDDSNANTIILRGHERFLKSVAFAPDRSKMASTSEDGTVRLWDMSSSTAIPITLDNHFGEVRSVTFSPNGNIVATASSTSRAYSASNPGKIRLWQVDNPAADPEIMDKHQGPVFSVAFSPDGETVASVSMVDPIWLWEFNNPSSAPSTILDSELYSSTSKRSISFSPDGGAIVSVDFEGQVLLWDVSNPHQGPSILGEGFGKVNSVAFATNVFDPSNDNKIVAGTEDGEVLIWDVSNLDKRPIILEGNLDAITSVVYTINTNKIAAGTINGAILIWDLSIHSKNLTEPYLLAGHQQQVTALAFAPDGDTLASGSDDRIVQLWQVADPTDIPLPVVLKGHQGTVFSLAFSPKNEWLAGNKMLVSGSSDGKALIWNTSLDSLAHIGCELVRRNLTWTEWKQFFPNENEYRCTCENLPPHMSVFEENNLPIKTDTCSLIE